MKCVRGLFAALVVAAAIVAPAMAQTESTPTVWTDPEGVVSLSYGPQWQVNPDKRAHEVLHLSTREDSELFPASCSVHFMSETIPNWSQARANYGTEAAYQVYKNRPPRPDEILTGIEKRTIDGVSAILIERDLLPPHPPLSPKMLMFAVARPKRVLAVQVECVAGDPKNQTVRAAIETVLTSVRIPAPLIETGAESR
jgi:hypothetical protein